MYYNIKFMYYHSRLSFRKFVKGGQNRILKDFGGGELQGYHSVHIGKQIPREGKTLARRVIEVHCTFNVLHSITL